jgi:sortase A
MHVHAYAAPRWNTRSVELALVAGGVALVTWWGASMVAAWAYQAQASRVLDAYREPAIATGPLRPHGATATRALASSRRIIGRIVIPTGAVSAVIAEGTDAGTLGRAVGHLPSSALPGEPGRVVLAGHRDTFFRGLERLRPGDTVRLLTPDGNFRYTVDTIQIVSSRGADRMLDEGGTGLTLVTCYPFEFIGAAPMRFVVRASVAPAARVPAAG